MRRGSNLVWMLVLGCATAGNPEPADAPSEAIEVPLPTAAEVVIPDAREAEPEPEPEPVAVAVARPIVVAGPTGVFELTVEGETTRTLSSTAARSPRWVPGKSELVFVGLDDRRSKDLRRIDLTSGVETVVAPIDFGPGCDPNEWDKDDPDWVRDELELTNEDELWAAADGRHVCLVAADYSADLRNVAEVHVFDLKAGATERLLYMAMSDCGRGKEHPMPKRCARPKVGDDGEWEEPPPAAIGGFVESVSPDGTWQLVHLASALGDVVHVQYALVEVSSGKSFVVGGKAGPWPKPRVPPKADVVEHGEGEWVEGWPDVGGDGPEWIGPHHLVVERQLLVAGTRVVDLPGDLAI